MTGAEGRAEQRPSGKTPLDPTPPSNPVKDAFTAAMGNYEELLTEVGVVEFLMVGMKPGLRTGYLFNVLTEDFTPDQMQEDPRFARLSEGSAIAMAQSRDHIPLRMANVTPSHAAEIRRRYEENGVVFKMQSVRTAEVEFAWESSGQQEAQDVLIGGLTSADDVIQAAAEIAARVEEEWGEDRAVVEKTFNLDALDLEDERASQILKDITFARNARLREYGLAQGFELLAEPQRVLQEIAVNMFDDRSVRSITELDVRAAIESGALATDFSVAVASERFVDITLERPRLEDIPDGVSCEVCSGPTQKTFLPHVSTGVDVSVRASVAGYRCQDPECGITAYGIEGFVEALTKASRILRDRGDIATATAFERRIETEQQIIVSRQTEAESARGA